ncbi:MOSC domain-containing protein [Ruegeria aquimaris]|uniref:MOSC domain-containing protein n=1 Tax=Ruegeria aquimaris TaxID=2984333 RepID=A0ABT3AH03_9RHOB|nr:MOSC domain-containing protein [Ruegeria sp. XHP0148]MCV2887948.1 MOSC domain-containing protein [Ruegeria sp. XHP0148]
MTELKTLIAGWAQPGRVGWIGLRPERRAALVAVDAVPVGLDGLAGDHGRPGKRAVTLVQGEHLGAIGSYLGRGAVSPFDLRRNIVVEGINLAALKDRPLRVGGAVLRLTVVCAPCSRMEETFGPGGYSAVRGHGGWCAEVLEPGLIRLGDAVRPAD